jgi:hypothetical protein
MQPQFESLRLSAQAYELRLRADAARTRSIPNIESSRHQGDSMSSRIVRAINGVVGFSRRFERTGALPPRRTEA